MRAMLLCALLCAGLNLEAQIYNESFDDDGFGIAGACSADPATCATANIPAPTGWTLSGDASGLAAPTDFFFVSLGKLTAQDLDAELCFESPVIDISGYSSVSFSAVISESGDHEANDYVNIVLTVDGNSVLIPEWIGSDSTRTIVGDAPDDSDWQTTTVVQTGISGSSLQIQICALNNAGSEQIFIDDVQVIQSDSSCGVSDFAAEAVCDTISENIDTYDVVITYTGSDSLASAIVNGNSGNISAGGTLDGSPIILSDVSENDDWSVRITGGGCEDTVSGISPGCVPVSSPVFVISELDCDQAGVDSAEFVELAGPPSAALDSFVLVLFNGSSDASYNAIDLDGNTTNSEGFFVICFGSNTGAYCDFSVSGSIQNGADGIGLYSGDGIDFPNGTPVTDEGLVDGLRYSTGDAIDNGLAVLDTDADCSGDECQVDEDAMGNSEVVSIQRGSWFLAAPTPGAANSIPLSVELLYFDVSRNGRSVILSWETVWEHHNDYFEVQHSTDGREFVPVGRIEGAHSSRSSRRYEYRHELTISGTHYFRLKSVDEDGSYEYSPIRGISLNAKKSKVHPTLVSKFFDVNWEAGMEADILVVNTAGHPVGQVVNTVEGFIRFATDAWHPGVYVVSVSVSGQREVFRIYVR